MAQDDGQELYFRLRENGATVFHLAPSGRENRLDMAPIASVNLRNGEIKRQGGHNLSPEESDQIRAWIEARTALVARREIDDILRTVEHLNLTAHWVQTRASADDLAAAHRRAAQLVAGGHGAIEPDAWGAWPGAAPPD